MVDLQTVCCMCGDVGFPDKLFRCRNCLHRFQHSYCSNYYSESSEAIEQCDWCRSEGRNSRQGSSLKKPATSNVGGAANRSQYSGDKIKQHDGADGKEKGRSVSGVPSPRTATRRGFRRLKCYDERRTYKGNLGESSPSNCGERELKVISGITETTKAGLVRWFCFQVKNGLLVWRKGLVVRKLYLEFDLLVIHGLSLSLSI